jgi:hypothetical protein
LVLFAARAISTSRDELHSGYSEHTGTSSRAAIFIGDRFRDGGILWGVFTLFKYFAGDSAAEYLLTALETKWRVIARVDH